MSARLRLTKLEGIVASQAPPKGRVFTIFRLNAAEEEEQIERLKREKGLCNDDQLIVIGWWGDDEPKSAVA